MPVAFQRPARAAKTVTVARRKGFATAVVAVTGTVDEVGDIIMPGAFTASLARIRPKAVEAHDWKIPVGRVRSIEELKPGDPRLPKALPSGAPWPAEAGAVVARVEFIMATQRGRDAYHTVRFYAETGEAAWSIGYKVVPGMTSKRADGVRVIYALDLYEVSPVLHGAHFGTSTLEVKSNDIRGLERKTVSGGSSPVGLVAAGLAIRAADTGRVLMLQRAITDDDPAGGTWEFPGGHIDAAEDPFDAACREWGEETGQVIPEGRHVGQWDASNGVYQGHVWEIPTETGLPINLAHTDRAVVNPDDPDGEQPEVLAWWQPVMLRAGNPAIRRELAGDLDLVHQALTGGARASMEAKTAADVLLEAKTMHGATGGTHTAPALTSMAGRRTKRRVARPGRSAKAAVAAAMRVTPHRLETKSMAHMAGSFEAAQELLREAICDLLHPPAERMDTGKPWVCLDATFPGHVFATTDVDGAKQTMRFDYRIMGDLVTLGSPVPAELTVVAATGELDGGEADIAQHVAPAIADIRTAVGRLAFPALEAKRLAAEVAPAVLGLLDALAMKGVDVHGMVGGAGDGTDVMGDDEDLDDEDLDDDGLPTAIPTMPTPPVADPAPADLDWGEGWDDNEDDWEDNDEDMPDVAAEDMDPPMQGKSGMVVLDPAEVTRMLAAVHA